MTRHAPCVPVKTMIGFHTHSPLPSLHLCYELRPSVKSCPCVFYQIFFPTGSFIILNETYHNCIVSLIHSWTSWWHNLHWCQRRKKTNIRVFQLLNTKWIKCKFYFPAGYKIILNTSNSVGSLWLWIWTSKLFGSTKKLGRDNESVISRLLVCLGY